MPEHISFDNDYVAKADPKLRAVSAGMATASGGDLRQIPLRVGTDKFGPGQELNRAVTSAGGATQNGLDEGAKRVLGIDTDLLTTLALTNNVEGLATDNAKFGGGGSGGPGPTSAT